MGGLERVNSIIGALLVCCRANRSPLSSPQRLSHKPTATFDVESEVSRQQKKDPRIPEGRKRWTWSEDAMGEAAGVTVRHTAVRLPDATGPHVIWHRIAQDLPGPLTPQKPDRRRCPFSCLFSNKPSLSPFTAEGPRGCQISRLLSGIRACRML